MKKTSKINLLFAVLLFSFFTSVAQDTDRVHYDRMYILQTLGYKITPPAM